MNLKVLTAALAALLYLALRLNAQSHLSVPVGDRLYMLLEIAELRGILPKLPAVLPYPESAMKKYLRRIGESSARLSSQERRIYRELMRELEARKPARGRFSIAAESEARVDLDAPERPHSFTAASLFLRGDPLSWFSYDFNVGATGEVANPSAFPPYAFSKPWDGQPLGKGVIETPGGRLTFHMLSAPELSAALLDGRLLMRWARLRREWGVMDGSLVLAGTARPFDGLDLSARLTEWAWFHFVTGSLGSYLDRYREQKMFTAHMTELVPWPWLYLSVWEAVVWGKRLELSYLNPFISYSAAQVVTVGNLDNVALGGEIAVSLPPWLRWYASVFLDELNGWRLDVFFENPRNMYAFSTGLKVPFPGLPLSLLTLQYSKIEPYTYAHYPQDYPFYDTPQNINYTNDKENLGYPLPPNSDQFLFKLRSLALPRLELSAQYQLIRHGDGELSKGQIEGDVDKPIDYFRPELYPPKRFLHDGIYEHINILRFAGAFSFDFGLTLWGEYGFLYARNFQNIVGNTVVKNLLALGARFRH